MEPRIYGLNYCDSIVSHGEKYLATFYHRPLVNRITKKIFCILLCVICMLHACTFALIKGTVTQKTKAMVHLLAYPLSHLGTQKLSSMLSDIIRRYFL